MYFIYMALAAAAAVVRNLLAKAEDIRDAGLISVSGRSPGGGLGNLLQYSCLENSCHEIAELDTTELLLLLLLLFLHPSINPSRTLAFPLTTFISVLT